MIRDERQALRFISRASLLEPEYIVPSAWLEHAPFAFWLVEQLRPRTIVELGTGRGFSFFTLCQAVDAQEDLNARCYAVDNWFGDSHAGAWDEDVYATVAQQNRRYAHFSTLMRTSFDEAVEEFAEATIDLLHIDGFHTYEAVRHDIETWQSRVSDQGVLLLHDTAVTDRSFGVGRAFKEIADLHPSFEFIHGHGLGVVGVGGNLPTAVLELLAVDNQSAADDVRALYARLGGAVALRDQATSLRSELGLQESDRSILIRKVGELEERLARARLSMLTSQSEYEAILGSTSWLITAPLRAMSRRHPRLGRALRHRPRASLAALVPAVTRSRSQAHVAPESRTDESYSAWIKAYDTFDEDDLDAISAYSDVLKLRPHISLLMPVFNPPERYLREAIDSVRRQAYENWQLCIADDGSTEPHVRSVLDECASQDRRISVVYRPATGGISSASNSALDLADGEFVGLVDHDDILRPHALLMVAAAIEDCPDAAYIYSDEDKIDKSGTRFGHYFKPDWSPTLLLCQNYLCHLSVLRTELVRQVGGFRSPFDGSQDWDLALRVTELVDSDRVRHIPHILYHWRAIPGSAAAGPDAKPYAIDAARRAVAEHLDRTGRRGYSLPVGSHQTVRLFPPAPLPKVSVLIPSTGRRELIEPCVDGLRRGTAYEKLEIIVCVGADGSEGSLEDRAQRLARNGDVDIVLLEDGPFNFSRAINTAARAASGSLLLLLNDDIEVMHSDWLEIMIGHLVDDDVGAVGPQLLYPDGTIQHGGVLLSAEGAKHLYRGRMFDIAGYINRARLPQDLSAVTGACMLVRRDAFEQVRGFDEELPVTYNDIDFCLKLRNLDLRVVYVPDAVLYHRESASFGDLFEGREREYAREVDLMRRRWSSAFESDPMHNPNLALTGSSPWNLAFPPRADYPWRNRRRRVSSG